MQAKSFCPAVQPAWLLRDSVPQSSNAAQADNAEELQTRQTG